jgi:hypothetical protein
VALPQRPKPEGGRQRSLPKCLVTDERVRALALMECGGQNPAVQPRRRKGHRAARGTGHALLNPQSNTGMLAEARDVDADIPNQPRTDFDDAPYAGNAARQVGLHPLGLPLPDPTCSGPALGCLTPAFFRTWLMGARPALAPCVVRLRSPLRVMSRRDLLFFLCFILADFQDHPCPFQSHLGAPFSALTAFSVVARGAKCPELPAGRRSLPVTSESHDEPHISAICQIAGLDDSQSHRTNRREASWACRASQLRRKSSHPHERSAQGRIRDAAPTQFARARPPGADLGTRSHVKQKSWPSLIEPRLRS